MFYKHADSSRTMLMIGLCTCTCGAGFRDLFCAPECRGVLILSGFLEKEIGPDFRPYYEALGMLDSLYSPVYYALTASLKEAGDFLPFDN